METYPDKGLVEIVFLAMGRTTNQLASLKAGDTVANVLGPLGHPTKISNFGTVAVIGGGVGIGAALPVAKALALLQFAEAVYPTEENLASVLHPSAGIMPYLKWPPSLWNLPNSIFA